ncbi:MAG TPA: ribonuclease III [Candidatus Sulfotelmatobacter sp.]|nr:ribonuclease III [Candidatus Sulfotelmatobacter sp.]
MPPDAHPAAALAASLGLAFPDARRLREALVHSSYPNEHPEAGLPSNERLEFLGDAVIAVVMSDELHRRHPAEDEGQLTARRAALVSTDALARFARRIDLGRHLLLGEGADRAGARERRSVLASAFEALVAAIYLDLGLAVARDWLVSVAGPELADPADATAYLAPKGRLQMVAQAAHGEPPEYRVVALEGPDHARHFVIEVLVGGRVMGRGEGSSRRAAETRAAHAALERLDAVDGPSQAAS